MTTTAESATAPDSRGHARVDDHRGVAPGHDPVGGLDAALQGAGDDTRERHLGEALAEGLAAFEGVEAEGVGDGPQIVGEPEHVLVLMRRRGTDARRTTRA